MESLENVYNNFLPQLASRGNLLKLVIFVDADQSAIPIKFIWWIFDTEKEYFYNYVHLIAVDRKTSPDRSEFKIVERKKWMTWVRLDFNENQAVDYSINFLISGFLKEWTYHNSSPLDVGIFTVDRFPQTLIPIYKNTLFNLKQIDPRNTEISLYIINNLGRFTNIIMPLRLRGIFDLIKRVAESTTDINCQCGERTETSAGIASSIGRNRRSLCGYCEDILSQLYKIMPEHYRRVTRTELFFSEIDRYRDEMRILVVPSIKQDDGNWITIINDENNRNHYLPESSVDKIIKMLVGNENASKFAKGIQEKKIVDYPNATREYSFGKSLERIRKELKQKNLVRTLTHPTMSIIFSIFGDEKSLWYEDMEMKMKRFIENPDDVYIRLYFRVREDDRDKFAKVHAINRGTFGSWLGGNSNDPYIRSTMTKWAQTLSFDPNDEYLLYLNKLNNK